MGSGITLIIDKIWWSYFTSINPPNHYILGPILIILGIVLRVMRR